MEPGPLNVVQFRASNLEGREELSQLYWVWVNEPPVAVIAYGFLGAGNATLRLSGLDSWDPDDSELNFTWYVGGTSEPLSHDKRVDVQTLDFPKGNQTFILVVRDPWGLADTEEVTMEFEGPPEPVSKSTDVVPIIVLLVIVLTIAMIALAVWYSARRL
jgi:hypothetical protein